MRLEMGIKGLVSFLKKNHSKCIRKAVFSEFLGQTWAVDVSIYLFKFSYNPEKKKPCPHIAGFYQLITRMLKSGIRPILVFDGESSEHKEKTLEVRRETAEKNRNKIKELRKDLVNGNEDIREKISQLERRDIQISPDARKDLKHLCKMMDVPYIFAPSETDHYCVGLYRAGYIDGVLSQDSDYLMYGLPLIYDFDFRTDQILYFDPNKLIASLELDSDQLLRMCLLSGSDYGFRGISCSKAHRIVFRNEEHTYPIIEAYKYLTDLLSQLEIPDPHAPDMYRIDVENLVPFMSRSNFRSTTVRRHWEADGVIYQIRT